MQRYNVFNLIHKGLRTMLFETAQAIQRTDFTDAEEATATLARVERVLFFFDGHAQHEDKFILPVIKQHNPQLFDIFEAEHQADHRMGNDLRAIMSLYQPTMQPERKRQVGEQVLHAFNAFVAFNLGHMSQEEEVLNQVLWEYHTDEQIQRLEHRIVSSISPDLLAEESRWMMRGINKAEATAWLAGARDTAPDPVFGFLKQLAIQELPTNQWSKVQLALNDLPVV